MSENVCNLYNYTDYRSFLSDWQLVKSKTDKSFSKSEICRKLGLPNTRSYFNDIVKGKPLTETYIDRFIDLIEMDKDEARYFRALVHYNQSHSAKQRDFLFDQLISLNKTPKKNLGGKELSFYKDWYHTTIRAMLDVYNIKNDFSILAKKISPSLSLKKVRESIQLLRELKLIAYNKEGFLKSTEKSLSVEPYLKNEILKIYQTHKFEQGIEAHLKDSQTPKTMATLTASMSPAIRLKIERKIRKMHSEIRSMVNKDPENAETVYQLNIQFFSHIK